MVGYLVAFAILLAAYAVGLVLLFRRPAPLRHADLCFAAFVHLAYLLGAVLILLDVGFHDWNFQNALPTANISPLTFFTLPLMLLLRGRARTAYLTMISLLSFGMVAAGMLTLIGNALRDYALHFTILLDSVNHAVLSLFGIYLVKSGQVRLARRDCIAAVSAVFGAAVLALLLNLIFHTAFFGLSLYGEHNIYNNVLTESGILSALLYFLGLAAVLLAGFLYCRILAGRTLTDGRSNL